MCMYIYMYIYIYTHMHIKTRPGSETEVLPRFVFIEHTCHK